MNRLILLGNGFDLAHKMKTEYYDFVFDYLKESFLTAKNDSVYDDDLISIRKLITFEANPIEEVNDVAGFMYFASPDDSPHESIIFNSSSDRLRKTTPLKTYNLKINNSFFNHLLKNCCDYKWVDIENEYYRELTDLLKVRDDISKGLSNLNNTLEYIIKRLEKYLLAQYPIALNNRYGKIFNENIKSDEVVSVKLESDVPPNNIQILNFNYTDTANRYILSSDNIQVNYIHGKLREKENPLIFGFGDELDENYSKIEIDRRRGFLKYIKSFWYFKTTNYHNLIRFIESDDFQVYILGHSCGLSDRTMLNMIFEHSNCKSIKIFYHRFPSHDNYTDLTEEISRHFRNKTEMRKKIVSKEQSQEMPQIS